jgi:hypothetical protein
LPHKIAKSSLSQEEFDMFHFLLYSFWEIYLCLYFATIPLPVFVYCILTTAWSLELKIPNLNSALKRIFPFDFFWDLIDSSSLFDAYISLCKNFQENNELKMLIEKEDFLFACKFPSLYTRKVSIRGDWVFFISSCLKLFDAGIVLKKLPLICFPHATVYFSKCPFCKFLFNNKKQKKEEQKNEENKQSKR